MQTETIPQNSVELTKARYQIAIAGYQQTLQAAENIVFSKDTLDQDYKPLKELRSVLSKIEELRKSRKAPHMAAGKLEDDAAKSLSEPLQAILDRKTAEYTRLATEIKADQEREANEQARKKAITEGMTSFILAYSQKIANATTNTELNDIERLINLETGRKEKYQEYLHEFKRSCEPIRGLLSAQKERVRSLATLEKDAIKAAENDDDSKAIELLEQKDQLQADIDLNRTLVQEEAIKSATSHSVYEVVLPEAPKARRTQWEVELVDIGVAMKACPDLVTVSLNSVAAKAFLKTLKEKPEFNGRKDFTFFGIRYYEKSIY